MQNLKNITVLCVGIVTLNAAPSFVLALERFSSWEEILAMLIGITLIIGGYVSFSTSRLFQKWNTVAVETALRGTLWIRSSYAAFCLIAFTCCYVESARELIEPFADTLAILLLPEMITGYLALSVVEFLGGGGSFLSTLATVILLGGIHTLLLLGLFIVIYAILRIESRSSNREEVVYD